METIGHLEYVLVLRPLFWAEGLCIEFEYIRDAS
jgi:hypothetical protein